MRILRIANVPDNRTGGMSRTMHATTDELRQAGHAVEQVFGNEFCMRGPRQLHRYSGSWEALRIVEQRLRAGSSFDVVEVHEPLVFACALRRRRNPRALPPVVAFSYGLEERSRRAMLDYRAAKQIPVAWKTRLSTWVLARQSAFGIRRADHIVCSNTTDVSHLAAAGVLRERVSRHRSGVEPVFLVGKPPTEKRNRAAILFVGSWLDRKGIRDLVPAFVRLCAEVPAAQLTTAGVGCDPRVVLEAFPVEVRGRVRVLPRIESNAELIRMYHQHAVFVLPSYFEGYPLSLVEAAACGLAPVVTDIGGNRDFVVHGENGLLVPVADPTALAVALVQLTRDGDRAARIGEQARASASVLTWQTAATNLAAAYAAAVGADAIGGC